MVFADVVASKLAGDTVRYDIRPISWVAQRWDPAKGACFVFRQPSPRVFLPYQVLACLHLMATVDAPAHGIGL